MTWPELQACFDNKRHELRLTGKVLAQRLEDSGGAVPEELSSPLFTFVELSGCSALTALPSNVGLMANLHELLATNNGLTALPVGFGGLPLLRTLVLEGNCLASLPDDLFGAPRLHTLNVSRNRLQALPDALAKAKELHVLNASFNELSALPRCVTQLAKLSALNASHNLIERVPAGISKLPALAELELAACRLSVVPQEVAAIPKLKALQLEDNPFTDKKLPKVLKEGRLRNVIAHIKKCGAPASAEQEAEAAEALERVRLAAEAAAPYRLLPVDRAKDLDVHVHPETKAVRPHVVCAVLEGVDFAAHPELHQRLVELQTQIHESPLANKREAAAIGTHDLGRLQLPLQYVALPPEQVEFVPLAREVDADREGPGGAVAGAAAEAGGAAAAFAPGQAISADKLPQYFAGDKTMLRYLSYVQHRPSKAAPLLAVLRDASGQVLSVSPVINADPCRVTPATARVLVEVSSAESLEAAQRVAAEFLEQFGRAWSSAAGSQLSVSPVRLVTHGTGHVRLIFPK